MKIEILDLAEKDLVDGFNFYAHQARGLGNYFIDSIFADIESIYIYAGIHTLHFGYHRLLSKRFPFAIYYRVLQDIIRIYAELDCRRHPTWTRERLR